MVIVLLLNLSLNHLSLILNHPLYATHLYATTLLRDTVQLADLMKHLIP